MMNRKEKHIADFMVEINRVWQLNLNEKSFLEEVLGLILKPSKRFNLVESALDEDYPMLLDYIPNHYIEDYAEDYLDMVEEDDCKSDLGGFSDRDLLEECEERGIDVVESSYDIVTDSQVSEMMDLFLSFSVDRRQDIINELK